MSQLENLSRELMKISMYNPQILTPLSFHRNQEEVPEMIQAIKGELENSLNPQVDYDCILFECRDVSSSMEKEDMEYYRSCLEKIIEKTKASTQYRQILDDFNENNHIQIYQRLPEILKLQQSQGNRKVLYHGVSNTGNEEEQSKIASFTNPQKYVDKLEKIQQEGIKGQFNLGHWDPQNEDFAPIYCAKEIQNTHGLAGFEISGKYPVFESLYGIADEEALVYTKTAHPSQLYLKSSDFVENFGHDGTRSDMSGEDFDFKKLIQQIEGIRNELERRNIPYKVLDIQY